MAKRGAMPALKVKGYPDRLEFFLYRVNHGRRVLCRTLITARPPTAEEKSGIEGMIISERQKDASQEK